MSKWREIRCDFFNEKEERYYVDAWKTGNDNEEGKVIAKIDLANGTVEYLDEDARTDEDAQVVINEFLENGYVLTEQSLNNDSMRKMEELNMSKYYYNADGKSKEEIMNEFVRICKVGTSRDCRIVVDEAKRHGISYEELCEYKRNKSR